MPSDEKILCYQPEVSAATAAYIYLSSYIGSGLTSNKNTLILEKIIMMPFLQTRPKVWKFFGQPGEVARPTKSLHQVCGSLRGWFSHRSAT